MVRSNSATIGIIALGAVALFAIASFHAGTDMDSLSVVARSLNLRAARCSGRSPCEDGEGRCRIDKQCVNSCIDGYCGSAVEDEPCRDGYVKNGRGDCQQVAVVDMRPMFTHTREYQEGLKAREMQAATDELVAAKRKADGEAQVAADKAFGEARKLAKANEEAKTKATKEAREKAMAEQEAAEEAKGKARQAAMKAEAMKQKLIKAARFAEMAKIEAADKAKGEARMAAMKAEAAAFEKKRAERQAVFDAAAAAPAPAPAVDQAEEDRKAGMARYKKKQKCVSGCRDAFKAGKDKCKLLKGRKNKAAKASCMNALVSVPDCKAACKAQYQQ